MTNLDSVTLSGNLTRNAELSFLSLDVAVINAVLAVNRRRKRKGEWIDYPNFIRIKILGKSAENLHKHLSKGRHITIQGELRQDRWEHDGKQLEALYVHVNELELGSLPREAREPAADFPENTTATAGRDRSDPEQTDYSSFEDGVPPNNWNIDLDFESEIPY